MVTWEGACGSGKSREIHEIVHAGGSTKHCWMSGGARRPWAAKCGKWRLRGGSTDDTREPRLSRNKHHASGSAEPCRRGGARAPGSSGNLQKLKGGASMAPERLEGGETRNALMEVLLPEETGRDDGRQRHTTCRFEGGGHRQHRNRRRRMKQMSEGRGAVQQEAGGRDLRRF